MDLSDEDVFAVSSGDEAKTKPSHRNPVEEHLIKQKHEVLARVEKAKNNVEEVRGLSEKIVSKLYTKALYGEDSGSDTESELYQVTGEPVIKKRRTCSVAGVGPLTVKDTRQKVIDEKWIGIVLLDNRSFRTLKEPSFYVFIGNERECRGTTSFWKIVDDFLWMRTEELDSASPKLAATVVLDLPFFENNGIEVFGTVSYVLDGKQMQTATPIFRFHPVETIDRSLAPSFTTDSEIAVLAIKAASIERIMAISLEDDPRRGLHLLNFLEGKGFVELQSLPDVYFSKIQNSFRHCIFEILPSTESQATVRISARSTKQMSILVGMLREPFPDIQDAVADHSLMDAASVLEEELKLELSSSEIGSLHMARIRTDLLIP